MAPIVSPQLQITNGDKGETGKGKKGLVAGVAAGGGKIGKGNFGKQKGKGKF